jgi:NTP pyrophosphatase (non-canonical NTP hydrolase)
MTEKVAETKIKTETLISSAALAGTVIGLAYSYTEIQKLKKEQEDMQKSIISLINKLQEISREVKSLSSKESSYDEITEQVSDLSNDLTSLKETLVDQVQLDIEDNRETKSQKNKKKTLKSRSRDDEKSLFYSK